MPIYEYKCKKCGEEFEVFHKMNDNDVKSCKFCRGPVNKLISLSSFQLQGSGWYVTDYGGKKPAVNDDKADAKKESNAPSDTKPAKEKAEATSADSIATTAKASEK